MSRLQIIFTCGYDVVSTDNSLLVCSPENKDGDGRTMKLHECKTHRI